MEEAYIVSAASVVVASRIDPNAARSSNGSSRARLTTSGARIPALLPPVIKTFGGGQDQGKGAGAPDTRM
ncbi:hypothetical protein ACFQ0B_24460 [Nonomuraea thailandensis]